VWLLLLVVAAQGRAADLDIAFIGTLSGASANIAQDQLDGFRLAVRHLGGRLGGIEFALSVVDDEGRADLARQTAEQFWQSSPPHVLLLSSSGASLDLLAPLAASHRSLIINLGVASAAVAGRNCTANLFSMVFRGDTLQEQAGVFLQRQGYRRIAVFDGPASKTALDALRRGFSGEIVEFTARPGSMDFKGDLASLRKSKVDAAYLLHRGGMAVEFLQQYAAANLKDQVPLTGPADVLDQTVLAASAPSALDLYSVGTWTDDLDSPANHRLTADFEGDYGRPVSERAASGYDAAIALDAAIRATNHKLSDLDAVRAALKRAEFPSTRGSFRFDNDQFPVMNFWIRQVVADQRGRLINEQRGLMQKDVHDSVARECAMRASDLPPTAAKPH
jgi:branched-chain amino acid transport system substrate-binding protein